MKLATLTTYGLIAAAVLAFSPAANAADARLRDCIQMAKHVSQALETAQPGQSTDAARAQASAGRSYCNVSMYAQGVARYTKALQLLGKS
jgi:hypothetical protein